MLPKYFLRVNFSESRRAASAWNCQPGAAAMDSQRVPLNLPLTRKVGEFHASFSSTSGNARIIWRMISTGFVVFILKENGSAKLDRSGIENF